jgi:hypothetical protein
VLARRDAGKELTCSTFVPAESFCTVSSERVYAHIVLTSDGQRTESVEFSRQIPPELTRDSLRAGLLEAWGQPDSTTAHREREPAMMEGVSVEWFGHWNSGTDYAFAYEIDSPSTGRTLRVTLANRDALLAREARYGLRKPSRDQFKP